ncbi:MAG TPA: right-handed parallel beta-helix repeat-containing protein, partial [Acetobacteraceae bacterium]|nr:right-handed parallel beta-helix repeat-containing protein [Acetobacteraceae bacterium]
LAQDTLLGRVGVQPGGPEPVGVGPGLRIADGQLVTDGEYLAPVASPAFSGTPTAPTQPAEDDSDAIATTAFVQQHTAQASPVKAVAGRTGYVALTASDVAGLANVATSGRYADLSGPPAADHFNVLDFPGAVADGVTHTAGAINAAIAAAAALPDGGTVLLPAGTWRIDLSRGYIKALPNVVLRGAGHGRTVLLMDDTAGAPAVPGYGGGLSNVVNANTPGGVLQSFGATFLPLTDFHLRDITVRGMADTLHSNGAQLVSLVGSNISVVDCEFQYARAFGIVIRASDEVTVRGCRVLRCNGDGIALWDVSNAIVTDNIIVGANDDAISAHSDDSAPTPVRSGLVIANNLVIESQGIKVLGAKVASITGNVLRRIMAYGIFVAQSVNAHQGGSPVVGVRISGNIITDVFRRSEPNYRNLEQYYIRVEGSMKSAGGGASAPGEPVVGSGVITPLYGSGYGAFYANNTNATAIASPGGWWVEVTDNQLLRTLPAPSAISDWGYSANGLWVGDNGDGSGYYNGAISEASMQSRGIYVGPSLHKALFARNLIQTSGARAIEFFDAASGSAIPDGAYQDVAFEGNRISDFGEAAIYWPTATQSRQRIRIERNEFDGDPQFRNANRGSGGTWLALGN